MPACVLHLNSIHISIQEPIGQHMRCFGCLTFTPIAVPTFPLQEIDVLQLAAANTRGGFCSRAHRLQRSYSVCHSAAPCILERPV